jgi:hypothetical protein
MRKFIPTREVINLKLPDQEEVISRLDFDCGFGVITPIIVHGNIIHHPSGVNLVRAKQLLLSKKVDLHTTIFISTYHQPFDKKLWSNLTKTFEKVQKLNEKILVLKNEKEKIYNSIINKVKKDD